MLPLPLPMKSQLKNSTLTTNVYKQRYTVFLNERSDTISVNGVQRLKHLLDAALRAENLDAFVQNLKSIENQL